MKQYKDILYSRFMVKWKKNFIAISFLILISYLLKIFGVIKNIEINQFWILLIIPVSLLFTIFDVYFIPFVKSLLKK